MKQGKWLLIAVGILMVLPGCRNLGGKMNVANTVDDKLVVPIMAGKTIPVGDINMWSDDDSIYIHYIMYTPANPADQWYLKECQADIALRPEDFPMTPPNKGQKGGDPILSEFAHQSGGISYRTEYLFTIPIGSWTGSVYVATHCSVCQLTNGVSPEKNGKDGWAGPYQFPGRQWATYFGYEFGAVVGGAQWRWADAWAGTAAGHLPFSGSDSATYVTHTIGTPTNAELYSGSTLCGTVTVTDDVVRGKGRIYVTYRTANGWYAKSFNADLALNAAGIPQVNGNPTPDQFRAKSGVLFPYVDSYRLTMAFKSDVVNIVVAAYANVGLYD